MPNETYSEIRSRAGQVWGEAAFKNKDLRSGFGQALRSGDEDGDLDGIYLHKPSILKMSRIGKKAAAERHQKHKNVADKIRNGLNKEFGWVKFNGQSVNVGDAIFEARIKNYGEKRAMRIDAQAMREIDRQLADFLEQAASKQNHGAGAAGARAESAENAAMRNAAARASRVFRQGWKSRDGFNNASNWQKRVHGGIRLKQRLDGIFKKQRGDVFGSKRDHFWGNAERDRQVDSRFKPEYLNRGLTLETLRHADQNLRAKYVEIDNPDLSDLYQTVNLDMKVKAYAAEKMSELRGSLSADQIDGIEFGEGGQDAAMRAMITEAVKQGDHAMAALRIHLDQAGRGGDADLKVIFAMLSESHSRMKAALAAAQGCRNADKNDVKAVRTAMREHMNLTHELAMAAMPLGNAGYLNSRMPINRNPNALNYRNPIYDLEFSDGVPREIRPAATLYNGVKGKQADDWQNSVEEASHFNSSSFRAAEATLMEFQRAPTDDNLAQLMHSIQVAHVANDRLRRQYLLASARRGKSPGASALPIRQGVSQQLAQIDRQRHALQELARMANDINEQRNLPRRLDNLHPADTAAWALRHNVALAFNPDGTIADEDAASDFDPADLGQIEGDDHLQPIDRDKRNAGAGIENNPHRLHAGFAHQIPPIMPLAVDEQEVIGDDEEFDGDTETTGNWDVDANNVEDDELDYDQFNPAFKQVPLPVHRVQNVLDASIVPNINQTHDNEQDDKDFADGIVTGGFRDIDLNEDDDDVENAGDNDDGDDDIAMGTKGGGPAVELRDDEFIVESDDEQDEDEEDEELSMSEPVPNDAPNFSQPQVQNASSSTNEQEIIPLRNEEVEKLNTLAESIRGMANFIKVPERIIQRFTAVIRDAETNSELDVDRLQTAISHMKSVAVPMEQAYVLGADDLIEVLEELQDYATETLSN